MAGLLRWRIDTGCRLTADVRACSPSVATTVKPTSRWTRGQWRNPNSEVGPEAGTVTDGEDEITHLRLDVVDFHHSKVSKPAMSIWTRHFQLLPPGDPPCTPAGGRWGRNRQ